MKIGNLDLAERVAVVAEIGNNHEGNFEVACELVRQAAHCGVDAVKFQTFKTAQFIRPIDAARFERLQSFELTINQFEKLAELAHSLGVLFISTPLDLDSAQSLEPLLDAYKIASCDDTFYPLLGTIAKTQKPVIVSTGISDWSQIQKTVGYIQSAWSKEGVVNPQLAVLHCVSSYPVEPEQANLNAIKFLQTELDYPIGYSDHVVGLDAAVTAVGLGARIVEKHFTLDRHYSDFRDHQLSSDPQELKALVQKVRLTERLLGSVSKQVQPCALELSSTIRRSIAVKRSMKAGEILTIGDLIWNRPGNGIPPGSESEVIGKRLKHAVSPGQQLKEEDFESCGDCDK